MQKALYAILVDGGYITKKLSAANGRPASADDIVAECDRLRAISEISEYELLRIYYYDAYPISAAVKQPVSGAPLHLGESERFRRSQQLFDSLVMKPHFALRMGHVSLSPDKWKMRPAIAKQLLKEPRELTDTDFALDMSQKGVDMRIGMDMARLALREMVRAVIVVTGDADFVPAFKFIRREGVKVILETMGGGGRKELREHADIVLSSPAKKPAAVAPQANH